MTKHASGQPTANTFRNPSDALRDHPGLDKEHLPVECPACGASGLLRIDHLDRNFVCKQCNKVFHVTTRELLPGKRAHESADVLGAANAYRKAQPAQGGTERLWSKILSSVRILLGSGLAIGVLLLIGNLVYSRFHSATTVPRALLERANYVGRAYARNDIRALETLVCQDMKQDVRSWLAETRPAAWERISAGANAKVTTSKLNVKRNLAAATVTIAVPEVPGQLTMTLYWLPESPDSARSLWLLDAKNTRRLAGKKKLALRNAESE